MIEQNQIDRTPLIIDIAVVIVELLVRQRATQSLLVKVGATPEQVNAAIAAECERIGRLPLVESLRSQIAEDRLKGRLEDLLRVPDPMA